MHDFIEILSRASSELSVWFAAAAVKGFIILAIATAFCVLLRRASASLKHLCWSVALVAILLLPLLSTVVPNVSIGMLPSGFTPPSHQPPTAPLAADQAVVAAQATATVQARASASVRAQAAAEGVSGQGAQAHGAAEAVEAPPARKAPRANPAAVPDRVEAAATAVEMPAPTLAPSPPRAADALKDAATWLFLLWAAVAGGILIHFLGGIVGVVRLIRRSTPVEDADWLALTDEVADRLELRRRIRLLASRNAKVPMTWGIFRPVIIIPSSAREWSNEMRRCVLAHEMAHVKRLDCLTQGIATAACALHWFNPMAWRAAKNLRLEREKACDDTVLAAARARASDYATHLLDIARSVPDSFAPSPVAVTMAARSQLEGRVLSILDADRRRGLSRAPALIAILLGACATLSLAAMQPTAASAELNQVDSRQPMPHLSEAGRDHVANQSARAPLAQQAPVADEHAVVLNERSGIDDVIKRSFNVSPGGMLRIDTDRGNIDVRTGASNAMNVEVRRKARGQASVEDFAVEFHQDGNAVEILGENLRDHRRGGDDVSVEFTITVPTQFNVELETAGGNVHLEDLDGVAEVHTSGGNLSFGRISGSVDASTSGGNVTVEGSNGDVDVRTSGGNVRLGRVGGTVDVHTSGGNISVEEVNGDIEAVTSGGMIQARLAEQPEGDCLLKTSGGSITVYLAETIAVDLYAKTSAGYVNSDLEVAVEGEIRPDRLQGSINGGGPELILDTSAGDVNIRRL